MPGIESLLERLVRGKVEFVVVGGYAAVAHGVTLVTQDVDICCRFTPRNLLRLQAVLRDLHPVHRMTPGRLKLDLTLKSCRGLRNLYLDTDWGQLDCLSRVLGLGGFNAVLRRSMIIHLPCGSCRVLTVTALIKAKNAMGRPRDRETVVQLKIIQRKS